MPRFSGNPSMAKYAAGIHSNVETHLTSIHHTNGMPAFMGSSCVYVFTYNNNTIIIYL
jgi:hypothetical protein